MIEDAKVQLCIRNNLSALLVEHSPEALEFSQASSLIIWYSAFPSLPSSLAPASQLFRACISPLEHVPHKQTVKDEGRRKKRSARLITGFKKTNLSQMSSNPCQDRLKLLGPQTDPSHERVSQLYSL